MTETRLSRAIRQAINAHPRCFVTRVNAGGYRGRMRGAPPGTADLIGAAFGKGVALEVKSPHSSHPWTPAQQAWARRWEQTGAVYAVVTSVEEALAVVLALGGDDGARD